MESNLKIGIISDCHLEHGYAEIIIPDTINVLVIAGDFHSSAGNAAKELSRLRNKTSIPIIYVAGNHEFYGKKLPKEYDKYRRLVSEIPDVYFLEKESVIINGVKFLGTTLWSDISNPIEEIVIRVEINDYKYIKADNSGHRITPSHTTRLFRNNVDWLIDELDNSKDMPVVVVTHHSPTFATVNKKYKSKLSNSAYSSKLADLILNFSPVLWIHGHQHKAECLTIGDTEIVSNPIGYPHERKSKFIQPKEFTIVKNNKNI